jgi:soluble lytic murein transglycosylase-like protein
VGAGKFGVNWLAGSAPYIGLLNGAEDAFGIPHNLLARIAFQESSWRAPVINGTIKSSAGAVGIMQLLPKYFPNAGASVAADIHTAAQLLLSLYHRFDDWQLAVAAYNWGGGNVDHEMATDEGLGGMPQETQNYVTKVFSDVPVPGSLV